MRPTADNGARVLQALDAFGAPRQGLTAADLARDGTIYQVGVPPNRIDVLATVDGVGFEHRGGHAPRLLSTAFACR